MARFLLVLLTLTVALRAIPAEQAPELRQRLKDPVPKVRLHAALTLAEANDAEAIPVLIDLLAELPHDERVSVEQFLRTLAGEWAPAANFKGEDDVARKIRRDAWAAWWRNVEGPALLALLRKHQTGPESPDKIRTLIKQLGAADFETREDAAEELLKTGLPGLTLLKEAAKKIDDPMAERIKVLVERIERQPVRRLPAAIFRLLAFRKPAGTVEALLAYLPHAEETLVGEAKKSLAALALREGKPEPILLRALENSDPLTRSVAAEALIHGGGSTGLASVRKLLQDAKPVVRMRVALAMATAKHREGVAALIDLLTVLPLEEISQVEDALYQLAGDSAPNVSPGATATEREKCRAAWAAWWKDNRARVDLGRLTVRRLLGFTLICDLGRNRVYEVDRHGKERWAIDNLRNPIDAWVLPGNRVLVCEAAANRVTEYDFKGKVRWQKTIASPVSAQPLPNGNTFIATTTRLLEVDRGGKNVYAISSAGGNVYDAYRTRKGQIACLMQNNGCLILDAKGKTLKNFPCVHGNGSIDPLPNGRLLVALASASKVVEYDGDGKVRLELNAPGATAATGLPNGHVLVSCRTAQRVYELDRAGKIVWELKNAGQAFRARRR
jgi:HEAT repeat protein